VRFLLPAALGTGVSLWYLTGLMRVFLAADLALFDLRSLGLAGGAVGLLGVALLWWSRRRYAEAARGWLPAVLTIGLVALAAYAFLFREAGGRLRPRISYALRDFVDLYCGGRCWWRRSPAW
jgi:hypothetical protein